MDAPQRLTASVVATFSDEELDRFLEASTRQGSGGPTGLGNTFVLIDIQDPQNLPASFIDRLRDRANTAEPTSSVNFDEVAARLQALVDAGNDDRPPRRASTDPLPSPDSKRRANIESERSSYAALVDDGGQPVYPIAELEKVVSCPPLYSDKFWMWQNRPTESDIFGKQLHHWRKFRHWQRSRRSEVGISECQRISKELLGDSAPSRGFQLKRHPSTQDRWTTWVEYISYSASLFNIDRKITLASEPMREKLWKKLQGYGVLRQGEDELSLIEGAARRTLERQDAERALQALGVMEPHAKPKKSDRRVLDAKRALGRVQRRNNIISKYLKNTNLMRRDEKKSMQSGGVLRWAEEQLSVFQRELSASKPAEKQNNSYGGKKGHKRRREDSATPEPASGGTKRQRISPKKAAVRDRKSSRKVITGKRENQDLARRKLEPSEMTAPRRSPRIAKLGALRANARG
ncbi:Uncharacterized protein TPAR_02932 [Tolypocladium paradoxum]|uniref:Uncharacterized protein n=1 Tax=Tolypocladium paradoxum TaxID=94208 RepID=A0A2S4L351_9HYPO|nr:Uncharacterized protein TPAR_02932 [Tolypocladium paradoxum]